MAADLPENYANHPAFQFVREVAVDWEESHVLDSEIGEFVVMARKERNGERWFIGAITNEQSRKLSLDLDFLDDKKSYQAVIYADGKNADWQKNPLEYEIRKEIVTKNLELNLNLVPGGGATITLVPVSSGKH